MDTEKKCSKCGSLKMLSEFSKDNGKQDGLWIYCKVCERARSADYRNNNREKVRLASRKWQQENPAAYLESRKGHRERNRATLAARDLARYHKDIEASRAKGRADYSRHRDQRIAASKQWRDSNPVKVRLQRKAHDQKRRAYKFDSHIRKHICQGTTLKSSDIPQELVELKRLQLQIRREIKKHETTVQH